MSDILLMHPPGFYDFRSEDRVYWPFMSSGGSELITPLYEVFPIGFKTLKRYLCERGYSVDIVNVSTLLLLYPNTDFERLIEELDVRVIGLDLHWMVHVQGCLAIARLIKMVRPDILTLLGGISSTYYADELMEYHYVDMVMRGYDTHEPMERLLERLRLGRSLSDVPNLSYREGGGVRVNRMSHTPRVMGCGMDLSTLPRRSEGFAPIKDVLTVENAGCAHNCGWCGGSRDSFRRLYDVKHTLARKDISAIEYELETLSENSDVPYNFYSLGMYSESKGRVKAVLEAAKKAELRSVMYDLFQLPSDEQIQDLVGTGQRVVINFSPQSHDQEISRLSGRGNYSMEEMERWIDKALNADVAQVDVYFFIGMPKQDRRSVLATVDYCRGLMDRFRGERVVPILCPMAPFLDPASNYFEYPEKYGYRLFYRTAEQHRAGMERASLMNRMNYETKWLSREELIGVSYEAIELLFAAKIEAKMFPGNLLEPVLKELRDAASFLSVVHEADSLLEDDARASALGELRGEIYRRNQSLYQGTVLNQAFPYPRRIGGRWYDEIPWSSGWIEQFSSKAAPQALKWGG